MRTNIRRRRLQQNIVEEKNESFKWFPKPLIKLIILVRSSIYIYIHTYIYTSVYCVVSIATQCRYVGPPESRI